ncbi:hypothetical protein BY457_11393 [Marinilabilia salmonicolor]|jgi:hypothetical protein|nr:hypothetical protein BY457_11393 [Marinilabilia salmonicolor]
MGQGFNPEMNIDEISTGLQAGVCQTERTQQPASSRLPNYNNAFVNFSKSRLEAGSPELPTIIVPPLKTGGYTHYNLQRL